MKINIALAGGQCSGKSTTSSMLFSKLKIEGYDYDLITEEYRKLKNEFGCFRSPFERFYMWRQQEREELRSTANDGFITDSPLFHYYIQAKLYAEEPRDELAIRELLRMCNEIKDRYQIIAIAKNIDEIDYKTDGGRIADKENAITKHKLTESFILHFLPSKLLYIEGNTENRVNSIIQKLKELKK